MNSIILASFIFISFILFQIILRKFNIFNSLNPIKILLFSIFNFALLILLFNFYLHIETEIIVNSLIHYQMLIMIYLHFIIGMAKSVSLRIVYEIFISNNKIISISDLNERYPLNDLFYKRIKLLLKNNWLRFENSKITYTNKAEKLIIYTKFIKKLLRIKISG